MYSLRAPPRVSNAFLPQRPAEAALGRSVTRVDQERNVRQRLEECHEICFFVIAEPERVQRGIGVRVTFTAAIVVIDHGGQGGERTVVACKERTWPHCAAWARETFRSLYP